MTEATCNRLRALATRPGHKLMQRDRVALTRAAAELQESERARAELLTHYGQMLAELVTLRAELVTVRQVLGSIVEEDDSDDPRSV
jgi:hypothetical protein